MTRSIELNGAAHETDATTLAELLAELELGGRRGIAVARNDDVVSRAHWNATPVEAGDVIEIVEATQGG